MAIFGPPADRVQQALKAERLGAGWLAFDRWRRPVGDTAAAITPAARMEIGSKLSRGARGPGRRRTHGPARR